MVVHDGGDPIIERAHSAKRDCVKVLNRSAKIICFKCRDSCRDLSQAALRLPVLAAGLDERATCKYQVLMPDMVVVAGHYQVT